MKNIKAEKHFIYIHDFIRLYVTYVLFSRIFYLQKRTVVQQMITNDGWNKIFFVLQCDLENINDQNICIIYFKFYKKKSVQMILLKTKSHFNHTINS